MRTRARVAARFYKSSDRTHITKIRWLKHEREEWEDSSRCSAARVHQYIESGDVRSALGVLFYLEQLEAHGISTIEHREARDAFMLSCHLSCRICGSNPQVCKSLRTVPGSHSHAAHTKPERAS